MPGGMYKCHKQDFSPFTHGFYIMFAIRKNPLLNGNSLITDPITKMGANEKLPNLPTCFCHPGPAQIFK